MMEINNQEQRYKKPSTMSVVGGVLVGSLVSSSVVKANMGDIGKYSYLITDLNENLKNDEMESVKNALKKNLDEQGLKAKGVDFFEVTKNNVKEVDKIFMEALDNHWLMKHFPKEAKEQIILKHPFFQMIKNGNNAAYFFHSKKIMYPENNKLILALFHEQGHAFNANLSVLGKVLQKSARLSVLSVPIALISLCKNEKKPGEKPKNKADKFTTFIKENCGKLTFLSFVPLMMEEGLASIRGNGFAKKLLSPELASKVAKVNAFGFISYLTLAIFSGLGIYAGTKVKDAIAKPKLIKNNNNKD